jgi:hypothetical protein
VPIPLRAQTVTILLLADRPREQTRRIDAIEFALRAVRHQCDDALGFRQVHAHDRLIVLVVRPKKMERVGMPRRDHVAGLVR